MDEFGKQLESQQEKYKNGIKNGRTGYADKKLYERFIEELSVYNKSGTEPPLLNHDEKYLLRCKDKKLYEMGIDKAESITSMPLSEISGVTFSDDKYILKHLQRTFRRRINFTTEKGKSFEKKQYITLEADLLNNRPNSIEDNEKLCCPVCGEIRGLKELENNCKNCGNASFITDLFPKVKRFFYKKSNSVSIIGIFKTLLICGVLGLFAGIPMGISQFISDVSGNFKKDTISESIKDAFTAPFEGILLGIVLAVIVVISRLIYKNVKMSALINKTTEAKTKIGKTISAREGKFSYDAFEGKIIYLIEMMIYNDDREKLPVCRLEKPLRKFNIVDSVYRGFMELKSINTENDIFKISLEVHMSDIYFDGKRFSERDDIFCVTIQKKITGKNNIGFELKNVTCPLCKEHFDAFAESECTFCGKEYDNRENDWTIIDFKIK